MEHTRHYADVRPAEEYAGKRVFIIGKQNSGFELANGLLPWARQLVLASPSTARLSVDTRSLVGVRARYVQPYEDNVLGGGVAILDAAIDRIEPVAGGDGALAVHLRRSDGAGELVVEADEVISATGFICPLQDLPGLGVTTFGASGLPAQTPWWESATVPGIFFAGTIGQGAKGLQRHGQPSNSGRGPRGALQRSPAGRADRQRRGSASRRSGPRCRPRTSWTSSRRSWPRPPSCGTSAATWPGS